jgi:hypothetical protein
MANHASERSLTQATLASIEGNWRLCADKYLEAYTACSPSWRGKYNCWSGFTSVLREDRFLPSAADIATLRTVAKSKGARHLERVVAYFTLGHCLYALAYDNREGAGRSYRRAINLIDSATDAHRAESVILPDEAAMDFMPKSCGPLLDDFGVRAQQNLLSMNGSRGSSAALAAKMAQDFALGVQGRIYYQHAVFGPSIQDVQATSAEINRRLALGGAVCDKCSAAADGRELQRCSRCGMAYYCNVACQKAAWKAGHKQACRKQDEVEVGDWMKLSGLVNRPELNGAIVEVLGPVHDSLGRWSVDTTIGGGGRAMSVASDKLEHLRPRA